jgi:hypothetical protein
VGKGTVVQRLLDERPDLAFSVSLTTREPRPGEVEGRDYRFVSEADFDRTIEADGSALWFCHRCGWRGRIAPDRGGAVPVRPTARSCQVIGVSTGSDRPHISAKASVQARGTTRQISYPPPPMAIHRPSDGGTGPAAAWWADRGRWALELSGARLCGSERPGSELPTGGWTSGLTYSITPGICLKKGGHRPARYAVSSPRGGVASIPNPLDTSL